ncbi:replication factor C small subunit [Candidatus Micrarchaeota archaeon]|nr:replication factor C small subunit [Candidatus Micrarchaeota archaeon]MBD3417518.1 replication factor C small subunit [Candidatus Micrarchaeota archaeon]
METDFLPWTEKYRPKSLSEVMGQEETVKSLSAFVKAKNMPNMLFAGPPGIGKTTATLALAHDLYGKSLEGNLLELNASDERGINIVRGKIKDFARSVSMGEKVPFKLIFLDEADALTPDAQHALRRTMEMYSPVTRFILSCNYSSKIIEPVQSRCAVFRFLPLTDSQVHRMIKHVADKEGLDVDEGAEEAIAYVSQGDMRKAINALQGAAIHSKNITEEIIYKISSRARPKEIREMVDAAYGGNFLDSRKMLLDLSTQYGLSGSDIILQVYREVVNLEIPEKKKVALVDRIGEYDFRLVEGANEHIQVEALLAQIMLLGMERE